MTKKNKILILFSILGLILIFLLYTKFNIPCTFKSIFNIPCPSCGMTRAFISILNLNFIESFHYNILSIPLFLIIITFYIITIIDIILNKQYLNKFIKNITKYYYIIIILLIISWIINIFKGAVMK